MQTHSYYIQYCFPFLPISRIVRMSRCTDLFVEVTNVTKGNGIWAHFVSTGYFPTQIQLSDQFKRKMYRSKQFVAYLNGLESIGQALTLQVYLEL